MTNEQYWSKRFDEIAQRRYEISYSQTQDELSKIYQRAGAHIKSKVAALYDKLAETGKLSTTELYNYGRYKALQGDINEELIKLGEKEIDILSEELSKSFEGAFSKTAIDLDKMLVSSPKISMDFSLMNPMAVEQIINENWSGEHFSSRIWKNKDKLAQLIKQGIENSVIHGEPKNELVKNIMSEFGKGYSDANRVARSEIMHTINEGQRQAYKQKGYTKLKILVAHDACDKCKAKDGMVIDIDSKKMPPFHANCRCTAVPEINSRKKEESFSYPKIKDEENAPEISIDQMKKEYAKYNAILGDKSPNIEEFAKIRYNNEKWKAFKSYTSSIKTGELSPLADFKLYQDISQEMDKKLLGVITSNGIDILGKSNHSIARIIGSVEQRRNGVSVDDVLDALTGEESEVLPVRRGKNGKSQKFKNDVVEVSINPDTGNIIQVNPVHRKKVEP